MRGRRQSCRPAQQPFTITSPLYPTSRLDWLRALLRAQSPSPLLSGGTAIHCYLPTLSRFTSPIWHNFGAQSPSSLLSGGSTVRRSMEVRRRSGAGAVAAADIAAAEGLLAQRPALASAGEPVGHQLHEMEGAFNV